MHGLSLIIRKDCFNFWLLWVRILRILWNIFIISKIFFFFGLWCKPLVFYACYKKKTDKGFRVQTMQLLGEELPCQQSASNWRTAAGAGRASPECWGRSGQHGAGVWWGGGPLPCTRDADRGHGLCTDLIPLSLHFRNTISRTVGLNISGSWISFENVRKNVHHVLYLQYPGEHSRRFSDPLESMISAVKNCHSTGFQLLQVSSSRKHTALVPPTCQSGASWNSSGPPVLWTELCHPKTHTVMPQTPVWWFLETGPLRGN